MRTEKTSVGVVRGIAVLQKQTRETSFRETSRHSERCRAALPPELFAYVGVGRDEDTILYAQRYIVLQAYALFVPRALPAY